jgi:hypothetical protein
MTEDSYYKRISRDELVRLTDGTNPYTLLENVEKELDAGRNPRAVATHVREQLRLHRCRGAALVVLGHTRIPGFECEFLSARERTRHVARVNLTYMGETYAIERRDTTLIRALERALHWVASNVGRWEASVRLNYAPVKACSPAD